MVWFPGVSGFGFRGVSGVCFGVAQDGVLLGGGFWRFWVCFLFWFVRTWGWGFSGLCGFFAGCRSLTDSTLTLAEDESLLES